MFLSSTSRFYCPEHKKKDDDDGADANDKVSIEVRHQVSGTFACGSPVRFD
jgi:hypothetical protein